MSDFSFLDELSFLWLLLFACCYSEVDSGVDDTRLILLAFGAYKLLKLSKCCTAAYVAIDCSPTADSPVVCVRST